MSATISIQRSSLVTSCGRKTTSRPAFFSRAASSGPFNSSISVATTVAPCCASNSTIAAPMPDAPPVTSATLPSTCPDISTPDFFLSDHRRALIRHRDVEHTELHTFGALPTVDCERARHMQLLAAILRQGAAELLSDRAECDTVDDGTVTGLEAQPQMRLPDLVGVDQLMRRQRDHRLRIGAAEGTRAIQYRGKFRRHRACAHRTVDEQFILVTGIGDVGGERLLHEGAEFGELLLAQRHAGSHRMTTAFHQQAVMHRLPHRLAKIDAADRAARSGSDTARLERDRKCRPRELLLQPRRHQPDHAGM